MTKTSVSRRRFLTVLAASTIAGGSHRERGAVAHEWNGTALGADARILLSGEGGCTPSQAIADCLQEIERLERIFSLYVEHSELVELNRRGRIDAASLDLRIVLEHSKRLHAWTGGLFNPTVQPLWDLYASWFSLDPARELPPDRLINRALARVGIENIQTDGATVRLLRGSGLTLNGIAQGYITDCVVRILKQRGWTNVLADVGEVAAIGPPRSEPPFLVEIRESGQRLNCADTAVATSAASALFLAGGGRLSHIIDPRTGRATSPWRCVTVRHASAMIADGLSTAVALATEDELRAIGARASPVGIWAVHPDGTTFRHDA